MGYYMGDAAYMVGGGYPHGGFFSKLKKKVSKLGKWVGKTAAKVGPILTVVNPALGAGVMSIGKVAGTVGRLTGAGSGSRGVQPGNVPIAPIQPSYSAGAGLTADQMALMSWVQANYTLRKRRR